VANYRYIGNRREEDETVVIVLERNEKTGEVTKSVGVGQTVDITQAKVDELGDRFVFEKVKEVKDGA